MIAAVLLGVLFFVPAARVFEPGVPGDLLEDGRIMYTEKLPWLILLAFAELGTVLSLFLFKKRLVQLRIAAFSLIVTAGLQGWLAWDYFTAPDGIVFSGTVILPAVAMILTVLAIKGIYADELLVRSASRLRSAKRKK